MPYRETFDETFEADWVQLDLFGEGRLFTASNYPPKGVSGVFGLGKFLVADATTSTFDLQHDAYLYSPWVETEGAEKFGISLEHYVYSYSNRAEYGVEYRFFGGAWQTMDVPAHKEDQRIGGEKTTLHLDANGPVQVRIRYKASLDGFALFDNLRVAKLYPVTIENPGYGTLQLFDSKENEIASGALVMPGEAITIKHTLTDPDAKSTGTRLWNTELAYEEQLAAGKLTFTMQDHAITVTGNTELFYILTIGTPANGKITVTDDGGATIKSGAEVKKGTLLRVEAVADAGYELSELKRNDVAMASGDSFAMGEATTISATFKKKSEPEPDAVESVLLAKVIVTPNPFGSQIVINNASDVARYALLSLDGRMHLMGNHDAAQTLLIATDHLSDGVYLLVLTDSEGLQHTIRLIKR